MSAPAWRPGCQVGPGAEAQSGAMCPQGAAALGPANSLPPSLFPPRPGRALCMAGGCEGFMECSVRVSPHHSLVRRSHNPSPLSGFSCHRKTEPPTLSRPLGSWWVNCDLEAETRDGLSRDPTPSAWGTLPPALQLPHQSLRVRPSSWLGLGEITLSLGSGDPDRSCPVSSEGGW